MMRSDALNSYVYPVRTKMTALSLHVYSTNEDESKGIIVNETLSQSYSTDEDELCSTEEDKSECTNTKTKDANNEVTYDVPKYFNSFNVFKCGRNILDRLDMSYERTCIATPKEEYFVEILDQLIEHNHCHGTSMSNEKLREAVIRVMEDKEKDAENNVNNVTMDTLFQSPANINVQKKDANVTYDRQIASGILSLTIK